MTSQTDTTEITYHAALRVVKNRLSTTSFDHTVNPRKKRGLKYKLADFRTENVAWRKLFTMVLASSAPRLVFLCIVKVKTYSYTYAFAV